MATATSPRLGLSSSTPWRSWWASRESTRLFWRILLTLVGFHAVVIAYAVIWIVWLGPYTGADTQSATFVPESVLSSCIGYSVVSLALFLGAAYASGYRQSREGGKVFFALTALYCGFSVAYVWMHFSLPRGLVFASDWLPIETVFYAPLLWPTYLGAALMAVRVVRGRRRTPAGVH